MTPFTVIEQAISSGNQDAIVKILNGVGENTTDESASCSVDKFEAKVKQVGDLLTEAGNSL